MRIGDKNKETAITVLEAFKIAIRKTGQINVRKENEEETIEYIDMAIEALKSQPKFGDWIPCSERLPNMEEVYKNDGRFILDDGNRRYQGIFDYTEKKFVRFDFFCGMQEDKCAIAWQPLPEAYRVQDSQSEEQERSEK